MCLQDVKLGRAKTVSRPAGNADLSPGGELFAQQNPNRAAYLVTVGWDDGGAATNRAYVRSGGIDGPLLAILTPHSPMLVLRVEDWGDAVFRPLYIYLSSVVFAAEVCVQSSEWLAPIDGIG